jgi:hypothetical protein
MPISINVEEVYSKKGLEGKIEQRPFYKGNYNLLN